MGLLDTFDVASARFMGLNHEARRENCQDYALWRTGPGCAVYAVGDGAGSGAHNEVGSAVGLEMLVTHVMRLAEDGVDALDWGLVLNLYLDDIEDVVRKMSGITAVDMNTNAQQIFLGIASQFFSHTVVLCVMDEESTQFVRFGDGYVGLNGHVISKTIDYEKNAPPFPIYRLYRQLKLYQLKDVNWEKAYPLGLDFEVIADVMTREVKSFMLGTDGLRYVERNAGNRLPGRDGLVGPIEQFMADRNLLEPGKLESRLNMIGMTYPLLEPGDPRTPEPGYLQDDVALIVGRQRGGDPYATGRG